jgi:hypothetical protein
MRGVLALQMKSIHFRERLVARVAPEEQVNTVTYHVVVMGYNGMRRS